MKKYVVFCIETGYTVHGSKGASSFSSEGALAIQLARTILLRVSARRDPIIRENAD